MQISWVGGSLINFGHRGLYWPIAIAVNCTQGQMLNSFLGQNVPEIWNKNLISIKNQLQGGRLSLAAWRCSSLISGVGTLAIRHCLSIGQKFLVTRRTGGIVHSGIWDKLLSRPNVAERARFSGEKDISWSNNPTSKPVQPKIHQILTRQRWKKFFSVIL